MARNLVESRISVAFAPIKDERQSLVIGLSASNSWHFRVDAFDVQDYQTLLRYSRKLSGRLTLSLQYEYDFVLLGNERYLSNHAGEFAWHFERPMNVGEAMTPASKVRER